MEKKRIILGVRGSGTRLHIDGGEGYSSGSTRIGQWGAGIRRRRVLLLEKKGKDIGVQVDGKIYCSRKGTLRQRDVGRWQRSAWLFYFRDRSNTA